MENLEKKIRKANRKLKCDKFKNTLLIPVRAIQERYRIQKQHRAEKLAIYLQEKANREEKIRKEQQRQENYDKQYQDYLNQYDSSLIGTIEGDVEYCEDGTTINKKILHTEHGPIIKQVQKGKPFANYLKESYECYLLNKKSNRYEYIKTSKQVIVRNGCAPMFETCQCHFESLVRDSKGKFSDSVVNYDFVPQNYAHVKDTDQLSTVENFFKCQKYFEVMESKLISRQDDQTEMQ